MNQLKHRFLFGVRFLSLVMILTNGLFVHAAPNDVSDAPPSASANQNHYVVKPGQSLKDVVAEMAAAGVVHTPKERAQLTSALLQANPRAFIAGDPNRLRKDAILILPPGFAWPQVAVPTASAVEPTLPNNEASAESATETQTQTQSEEQAAPSSTTVEQQTFSAPVSAPVAETPPVISASSASTKVSAMLSSWRPQFTSIPKALMFVIAAAVTVLLVLILSLFGHRRAQKRMNEKRTHSVAPAPTNETELTQESSDVDEMMAQVATWAKQHPPALPQPVPSSPIEETDVETSHLPDTHLAEEAQPELNVNDDRQLQTDVVTSEELREEVELSEPAEPATTTIVSDLASSSVMQEANEIELKKLEKASEALNLGDLTGARALISEITELVETRLIAEQTKQTSIESATDGTEEISAVQKEKQQQTVPSASDSKPLPLIDLQSEATESPLATSYSEKMVAIERNKLSLVGEYLKLGDIEGARLLAQEVAASADSNLRARAEQILASLPSNI